MCEQGTTVPMPILGRVRDIDSCIALFVATLNTIPALTTTWCCCGHGKMLPVVGLEDGSHILVIREKPTFDRITALLTDAGIQQPLHPAPHAGQTERDATEPDTTLFGLELRYSSYLPADGLYVNPEYLKVPAHSLASTPPEKKP